jgi:hypothetical protein
MKNLNEEETDIINRMVEPFVQAEHEHCGNPCAVGTTERGVVVTMLGGYKILVRINKHTEKIPSAE